MAQQTSSSPEQPEELVAHPRAVEVSESTVETKLAKEEAHLQLFQTDVNVLLSGMKEDGRVVTKLYLCTKSYKSLSYIWGGARYRYGIPWNGGQLGKSYYFEVQVIDFIACLLSQPQTVSTKNGLRLVRV